MRFLWWLDRHWGSNTRLSRTAQRFQRSLSQKGKCVICLHKQRFPQVHLTWIFFPCKRPVGGPRRRERAETSKTALSHRDYLRFKVSSGIQRHAIFMTPRLWKAPCQRDKHLKSCERLIIPWSWSHIMAWQRLEHSHSGRGTTPSAKLSKGNYLLHNSAVESTSQGKLRGRVWGRKIKKISPGMMELQDVG